MKRNDDPAYTVKEIRHSVISSRDILAVRLLTFEVIPAKKFVRKKEKRTTISKTVVGEYKIEIPFTERRWKEKVWKDYTHFHNDSEEVEVDKYEKIYSEPELSIFIKEKVDFHLSQIMLPKTN